MKEKSKYDKILKRFTVVMVIICIVVVGYLYYWTKQIEENSARSVGLASFGHKENNTTYSLYVTVDTGAGVPMSYYKVRLHNETTTIIPSTALRNGEIATVKDNNITIKLSFNAIQKENRLSYNDRFILAFSIVPPIGLKYTLEILYSNDNTILTSGSIITH